LSGLHLSTLIILLTDTVELPEQRGRRRWRLMQCYDDVAAAVEPLGQFGGTPFSDDRALVDDDYSFTDRLDFGQNMG